MSSYFTMWVSFGILSPFLLAVGAVECSEKETLLQPKPGNVSAIHLSDCLMECTWMTYLKKLQLQDNHNIRLQDSTEGDLGEYCWSTELKCTIGERFQHAYVVLPVDLSAAGHEQLEVKVTPPTATTLLPHNSPPQSQTVVASDTMSRCTSAQGRRGCHSAYRLPPRQMSWWTESLNVLPFWSLSGRENQISPTKKVEDKISVMEEVLQ